MTGPARIYPRLLEVLRRGFARTEVCPPEQVRAFKQSRRWWRHGLHLPGSVLFATIDAFVAAELDAFEGQAESAGDAHRAKLRLFLRSIGVRPSLLGDTTIARLGLTRERRTLVHAILEAFPRGPLAGASLAEALLHEAGWTSRDALAAARGRAEREDWTKISARDIESAFQQCSVYAWLDPASLPFYVPAFLRYAAMHPASRCEHVTMDALALRDAPAWSRERAVEISAADAARWTPAQRECFTLFVAWVRSDSP